MVRRRTTSAHSGADDDELPPGLENSGNLCWLNAVMQALTHCDLLVDAIDTSMHCLNCTVGPAGGCVLCSVETHIKGVSSAQRASVIAPKGIVKTLPVISQTLLEGQQEDAHEFLRNLVSGMQMSLTLAQERLSAAGKSPPSPQHQQPRQPSAVGAVLTRISSSFGLSSRPSSSSSSSSASAAAAGSRPSTGTASGGEEGVQSEYPFSLFRGSVHSQVTCTRCGRVSVKADPIEDLELEVSRASTLETALSDFCRVEVLSGANAYSCDVCRAKTTAHRCLLMHTVPAVLSIQLKRFVFHGKSAKITHFVQYPEYLDLAPFLTDEAAEAAAEAAATDAGPFADRPRGSSSSSSGGGGTGSTTTTTTTMELFAVVVHLGKTMQAGHYVAYVRIAEQGWFRMDDSVVRRCSTEEAMGQSAYILFYQQDRGGPGAAGVGVGAAAASAAAAAAAAAGAGTATQSGRGGLHAAAPWGGRAVPSSPLSSSGLISRRLLGLGQRRLGGGGGSSSRGQPALQSRYSLPRPFHPPLPVPPARGAWSGPAPPQHEFSRSLAQAQAQTEAHAQSGARRPKRKDKDVVEWSTEPCKRRRREGAAGFAPAHAQAAETETEEDAAAEGASATATKGLGILDWISSLFRHTRT